MFTQVSNPQFTGAGERSCPVSDSDSFVLRLFSLPPVLFFGSRANKE